MSVQDLTRPVLRYHGGKWKLAPWIISHFPAHRTYVEPFGGGGSVLLRKPRCYSEVYNDQWRVVVDVFRCMRDPTSAAELEHRLRLTPYGRDEFKASYILDGDDLVERARKTIVRSFMGFGSAATNGEYLTGFRGSSRRSGTTPALDWVHYPDLVRAFCDRLQGVMIENLDAAEVIRRHDDIDTLVYCDPPYVHDTRNMRRGNACYAHEMQDEHHEQLAALLHSCRGMIVVSGYDSPLYDRLFADWRRSEVTALADGARPRVEILYLNPAIAARQSQARLFA